MIIIILNSVSKEIIFSSLIKIIRQVSNISLLLFFNNKQNGIFCVAYTSRMFTFAIMNWHDKYASLKNANPLDCVAGKLMMSLRTVSAIYRKHLKKHRLTMSQWSILQVLAYNGEMPQAMLGKMLKLDRSTITRDLKRLLEKGYLERNGEVNKKNVGLTESGAQFVENVIPDWQNATTEAGALLGHDGMESLNIVLSKFFKYS